MRSRPVYFATPNSPAIRAAMRDGLIGAIETPYGTHLLDGIPMWCADNGCFGANYVGDAEFLEWLEAMQPHKARCWFAVAPDIVGEARATLDRSAAFLGPIRDLGYKAAQAAQNGLTPGMVPWDAFDVLFLGGVPECLRCDFVLPASDLGKVSACPHCRRRLTEWKLGAAARALTGEALRRGKRVHMGRVNSLRRYRYADLIGCASVDGTFVARWPDTNLPELLSWARDVRNQGVLWEAS